MSLGRVLVSLLGTRNSLSPFRLLYVVSPSASCFRGKRGGAMSTGGVLGDKTGASVKEEDVLNSS